MRFLFLLFIIVPVLEITLLIRVGGALGVFPTVFLVLGTAFVGIYLLRQQGLNTLFRMNQRLATGQLPAREMLEGIILAVGGAMLLTPGFITDTLGLICVLPGSRQALVRMVARRIQVVPPGQPRGPFDDLSDRIDRTHHQSQGPVQSGEPSRHPETIDGEFRREDQ